MKRLDVRRSTNFAVCGALLLLGCTRNEPAHQVETAPPAATAPAAQADAKPQQEPTAKQGPLPVSLVVEQNVDGVALRVLVTGNQPVELAQAVMVQPSAGNGAAAAQALTLRRECAQQACTKLLPGTELTAPRSLGVTEPEPCKEPAQAALDRRYVPSQAGEYVLTVRACDGAQSSEARFRWTPP